jgi:hypothetical protein
MRSPVLVPVTSEQVSVDPAVHVTVYVAANCVGRRGVHRINANPARQSAHHVEAQT